MKAVQIIVLFAAALELAAAGPVNTTTPRAAASVLPPMQPLSRERIEAERLGNSDYCGHCHTDIFHQWNASAHHFSSFNNPVYRRVALDSAMRRGGEVLQLCARCHDPLPLAAGEALSSNLNRWSANAGLTCLACHRITEIHGSNGGYTLSAPVLHPFALSAHPLQQQLHHWLLRVTPGLHRAVLSKPFYESPQYCAACHTVVVPGAVNGRQDLTLQDEHGQWQRSHYADGSTGEGRRCVDCHMPLVPSNDPAARDGLIRSHRFTGGNTLLPSLNRDMAQLRAVERFLSSNIAELSCSGARSEPQAVTLPCAQLVANAGDRLRLYIDIKNVGVGHDFPAGTADSNEAWLELEITDAAGRSLLHTGARDAEGNVAADGYFLRTVYVDRNGRQLDRRSTTTEAVAVASTTVIPPGKARRASFEFAVPAQATPPLSIHARLNWRKYSPALLRWVFEQSPPDAPVTTLAQLQVSLPAAVAAANPASAARRAPHR